MGFISKRVAAQNDISMTNEVNRLAHSISTLILQGVDGSNSDEKRLILNAKQLGDLANSNATWRLTSSYLLATCERAVHAVDLSTDAERQLYYEALDLLAQFEYGRASCA